MLPLEECVLLVKAFVALDVKKCVLLAASTLVRKNALWLFNEIGRLPGLNELVLTTDSLQLGHQACAIRRAGVRRVNISLDSLDKKRFRRITRVDELDKVLRGIAAAKQAGF